jgi:protein tyrosine/serine phosphatase
VSAVAGRIIELQGLYNVRDLGGHSVSDGAVVRTGLLYRGAGLHQLGDADVEAVTALGLRTVFDLRTPGELRRFGEFPSDRVAVVRHHAPMLKHTWRREQDSGTAVEMLGRRYASMLESGRDAVRVVVERIGDPEALPAAFFCAAGKDRTGVMAAILLAMLGVPDDEIVADYALSEASMPALMSWLATNEPGTSDWIASLPPALLEAPAEAMQALLATLRDRHGSVEAYVSWCGAADSSIAAVRAALVG